MERDGEGFVSDNAIKPMTTVSTGANSRIDRVISAAPALVFGILLVLEPANKSLQRTNNTIIYYKTNTYDK